MANNVSNIWFRDKTDRWRLNFAKYTIHNIWIVDDQEESLDDSVFKGTIKNKSELKKILKQIGVWVKK